MLLLIAPIAELIPVDYPTETHRETYRNLGWSLLVLVPLIPAAIAWQRRLIGSRPMVLLYSATMLVLVVLLVIVPAVTSTAMEYGVIITVPILLVIVAWRWHLIGGISIVLWSACYFAALMYINSGFGSDGSESFTFLSPLAVLFLISGMLYLIVWWREKRKEISTS